MSVVTFLFTDIEGSTRRWEADADAMRAALAAHDESGAGIVGSTRVRCSSTPVTACAQRSRLRGSAVDAAMAAQRALGLPVRMGIATGEAELRGDDYFGAVLNRAARVMAAGHGGQILLDGATAELAQRRRPASSSGPGDCAIITKPVDVFQVSAPGLAHRVPAAEDARDNAGEPASAGDKLRRSECGARRPAAALKAHRLVTLTGVGGVGKTRLALRGQRALGARLPRRGLDDRTGADHRCRRGPRGRRGGVRNHAAAWHECGRKRGVGVGGTVATAGVRQLRTRPRRRRRHDREDPGSFDEYADRGHQPRRHAAFRRTPVAGAIS